MTTLLVTIHIIICFVLALSILLQAGKGGSLAGALGGAGGATGTVLGSRGAATMLGKITTYTAILFLISCMVLTLFIFRGGSGTEIETAAQKEAAKRRLMPLTAPEFPPSSEVSREAGSTSGETTPSSETSGGGETEKTE